jgi:YfiH family protein
VAYTSRDGGTSEGAWASFNLGAHVGDDADKVAANRARLRAALPAGAELAWLNQVHGNRVHEFGEVPVIPPQADACWTAQAGIALPIMTADCLPILLADRRGTVVAAVHAGWRGLACGVLEATIAAMPVAPGALLAWLGPAIGADAFEVGAEVRMQFLADADTAATRACFRESPGRPGHFLADLRMLATQRLARAGVPDVQGVNLCTYSLPLQFFSYRRDGVTGRMASLILRLNTPLSP